MTEHAEIERPARLALVMCAVWAGAIGAGGPTGPLFPVALRATIGGLTSAVCLLAAVLPGRKRIRVGLMATATFAIWSVIRVVASDNYDPAVALAAIATYATLAVLALALDVMTVVLAGIDAAVRDHEADE